MVICTCDRPGFLGILLTELTVQAPHHPIVVVDNGAADSRAVVQGFDGRLNLFYDRLEAPGVVAARNRAFALALDHRPEFLVFIDDDEVPGPDWLANLMATTEASGADIVTGPVLPEFLSLPPSWVLEGRFFDRLPGIASGNLALRRTCLPPDPRDWFHPALNFLGAEDEEFLRRLMANGARYAAAETAVVREFVPKDRLRRRYIWGLGLRDGLQIAQLEAIRGGSRFGRAGRLAWLAAGKAIYGCNHLFWALRTPWRAILGLRDFAAMAGIVFGALGIRLQFYGRARLAKAGNPGIEL